MFYLTMQHYFCIIFAIEVHGQTLDHIDPVSSTGILDNIPDIILDQNAASGQINNHHYEGDNYGNKYNGKYFGKDVEEHLYDRRLSQDEKFKRQRGLYEHYQYDDGNPDVHGRIERPCHVYDTFCIRKFFAEHSQCKISGRQVPEPLYRAQSTLNVPNTNMSATLVNIEYQGIKDGRIAEFYIDKATDNLVITIDFDRVTFVTPNVNLKFYLRGREPIVTRDAATATFVKVSATAVIPNLKDLRLDLAEIFTINEEFLPPFAAGPGLAVSTDPEALAMFGVAVANALKGAMEALLTEGVFYISNFIHYNICDFGLKVI